MPPVSVDSVPDWWVMPRLRQETKCKPAFQKHAVWGKPLKNLHAVNHGIFHTGKYHSVMERHEETKTSKEFKCLWLITENLVWTGSMACNHCNRMTLWNRWNHEDGKKISGSGGRGNRCGAGEGWADRAQGIYKAIKLQFDAARGHTALYLHQTPSNVQHEPWNLKCRLYFTAVHQYWLLICN